MAVRLPSALVRAPVRSAPLQPVLAPLFAILLLTLFLLTRDALLEVPLLYSRCHSHALHPSLSRAVPFFGSLACFAVAFFENALASTRGVATMAAVFAFTAALLTVSYVESSRRVAGPAGGYLRRLGLLWVLVHIGGGPFVFVFIAAGWIVTTAREVRRINLDEEPAPPGGEDDGGDNEDDGPGPRRPVSEEEAVDAAVRSKKRLALRRRRLRTAADALAISDAVIIGFALPAALTLVYRSVAPIAVWLFFPVWVIVLRHLLLIAIKRLDARWQGTQAETTPRRRGTRSLDLESNRLALALVYVVPVLLSLAAHVALIWSLSRHNDSKSVTRAVLGYEAINWGSIFAITLYSLFVEAGWFALLGAIGASVVLGPGAGVCIGWILRERVIRKHNDQDIDALASRNANVETEAGESVGEHTPLLRP